MTPAPSAEGAWAPFGVTKRLSDLEALFTSSLLADLGKRETGRFIEFLEARDFTRGALIASSAELADNLHWILEGRALLSDHGRQVLGAGAHVGDGAFVGRLPAAPQAREQACLTALTGARVVRLERARYEALCQAHPEIALPLTRALASSSPQGAPRLTHGRHRIVELVPAEVAGSQVVGARLGERVLALHHEVSERPALAPLTLRDWEGRDIYRRSGALVALEAARRLGVSVKLGPSWTSGRILDLGQPVPDPGAEALRLTAEMDRIIEERLPFLESPWSADHAAASLRAVGDEDAALLVEMARPSSAQMVTLGAVSLPSAGPTLPHTGWLERLHVLVHPGGMFLDFGAAVRRELAPRPQSTLMLETRAPRYGADMTVEQRSWLAKMGIHSVGHFNRACVTGEVGELIQVVEGFHEKRIAEVADTIHARGNVRVIAVAGPSSSGKTTFLKRLMVGLKMLGHRPTGLSLDDYYLDRDKTARDASGELDFESLDALDTDLIERQVAELLAGRAIRPARFDFQSGKSHPSGGPETAIAADGVLLLEGIQALNPRLLQGLAPDSVFRVFIHPATALRFDALSSFEPTDLRLLRRIVRDRRHRGATAEESLSRWPSVRRGERMHIYPCQGNADRVFDSALVYEVSVLKVFAERYLLEVPRTSPVASAAWRLRTLIEPFVAIYPDHVPPTSILREFIGGSGFTY